jgi:hypothetical protein
MMPVAHVARHAALVDHKNENSCLLHGCAPPLLLIDGNQDHRCDLKESLSLDNTKEQLIDVDRPVLVFGSRVRDLGSSSRTATSHSNP